MRPCCAGIIGLDKSLGAVVAAEGVETTAELDGVTQEGCDLVQGLRLGPSVAIGEVLERHTQPTPRRYGQTG